MFKVYMCVKMRKNQSTKTNPELTQMLEFLDKNIKRVIITAFHILKRLEKMLNMLSRGIKGTKKNKSNSQRLKTAISEMKIVLDEINIRLGIAEEITSELEDTATEIIQQ